MDAPSRYRAPRWSAALTNNAPLLDVAMAQPEEWAAHLTKGLATAL